MAKPFDAESWIHRFEMWGGSVFIWKGTLHIGMAAVDGAQLRPLLAEVEGDPQRRGGG